MDQRHTENGTGRIALRGILAVTELSPIQEDGPSAAEYDLEISYTPSGAELCLDDPFELGGGDDTADRARVIRYSSDDSFPSETRGQICAGDTDYICFEMRSGELLSVEGSVVFDN